jgi:hypothetical protein
MAIPTDFTGDPREDDPESSPPPLPPSRPTNTSIPRAWGAPGVAANQGGNTYQSASQQIQDAYRLYLDRDASPQEIADQLSGGRYFAPVNVRNAINNIQGSEEARKYRMSQTATAGDDGDDGDGDGGDGDGGDDTGVPARTGQAPPGYDQGKWADPEHHTAKYDAAAFLYGLTKPSEIAAMVRSDAFQARFRGATFNDKDKIDFGSNLEGGNRIGVIDVLMRADQGTDTSGGLWWGADGGDSTTTQQTQPLTTQDDTTNKVWTQPPDSVLFNPPLTQGPPSMGPGGGGMMGPGGGGGTMGQMITPYNPLATYSPTPYTTPDPYRPPAYEGATPFEQDPYAAAVPFTGPTAEDMAADPSYQFRLRQGQEALERSGAALGVTNTGGTLKDILDYGQRAASQEYGNVFGRQRDVYDLNERNRFNAYQANWGNAMDAYAMNERNRAGAFATNIGTARDAYAMNVENRYQGYATNELARWQENQEAEARRSGAYGTNLGAYERQQQYGLKQQGQGFDQSFRNWQEQYNQGRETAQDTYNRMRGLATT